MTTTHTRSLRVVATLLATLWGNPAFGIQRDQDANSVRPIPGDSVVIRMADLDIRTALMTLAKFLDKPLLIGSTVTGGRVSLETPRAIARRDVPHLAKSIAEGHALTFTFDSAAAVYRAEMPAPPAPVPVAIPTAVNQFSTSVQTQLWVIPLRHARAVNVAATVNALYGKASAFGEIGARPSTLGDQNRRSQLELQRMGQSSSGAASANGDTPQGAGTLSGENAIVPDDGTNSLLMRGTRRDFELVSAAVKALDIRPLQVLIEMVIAEVRRDRSLAYGLDLSAPPTAVPGAPNYTAGAAQTGASLGDFVIRVMRRGSTNIEAVLRAAASRGDARIISRPVVLAVNNESAELLVGSQRPFIQVQRSLPTDAPSRDQVVQYRDVGTRLAVRPTISTDGYVALQITQEVNAATAETQFDAPVISTRNVQTRIVVRDSQTIVLGGLTDQQRETTQGGTPFLSSIPWIGGLFGRVSRRSTVTEFFLFLTPRIIRDDDDVKRVTDPLEERTRRPNP